MVAIAIEPFGSIAPGLQGSHGHKLARGFMPECESPFKTEFRSGPWSRLTSNLYGFPHFLRVRKLMHCVSSGCVCVCIMVHSTLSLSLGSKRDDVFCAMAV